MSQAMRRAPSGAHVILSLAIQAITVLAPSTPPRRGAPSALRPHRRDGVTVAARRDAPAGVGTRNVPKDSPTPPAWVEQGTMATKPAREQQAKQPSQRCAEPQSPAGAARSPRTNPASTAQPRASTPSAFCKSVAYTFLVSPCKSIAQCTLRDLANPSPAIPAPDFTLLHIRRPP
jgi:hypothetical protein